VGAGQSTGAWGAAGAPLVVASGGGPFGRDGSSGAAAAVGAVMTNESPPPTGRRWQPRLVGAVWVAISAAAATFVRADASDVAAAAAMAAQTAVVTATANTLLLNVDHNHVAGCVLGATRVVLRKSMFKRGLDDGSVPLLNVKVGGATYPPKTTTCCFGQALIHQWSFFENEWDGGPCSWSALPCKPW